jgi:heme/copper-type cytochrome/quinol oxidase subunit 4
MNITDGVVSDLLPVYFSGDASSDTKSLVEDYFRQNPEFERLARSAGTTLETLSTLPPVAADSEKEKRDIESIRCGLNRRKWLFGLSLFLTLSPFWFYFTHGHLASLIVGDNLWKAAFDWSMATVFWFLYFAQLRGRTVSLVIAIFLTLIPIPFALHFANAPGGRGTFAEAVCIWIGAAFIWIGYFRQRSH